MAKYTDRQKSEIEYLINQGTRVHKKKTEAKNSEEVENLQNELNSIKLQLNEALNAESIFREHLKKAQEHLDAAQAIKDKWTGGKD